MSKKVKSIVKLAIDAGKANPAPPVGTVLGPTGINIQQFCQAYNDQTKEQIGMVIPVVITIYEDRSFTFVTKTPPASRLLLKYAGISKGSSDKNIVGTVSKEQLREIAEIKLKDLNANDIEAAMCIVEGTAKNMGIKVEE